MQGRRAGAARAVALVAASLLALALVCCQQLLSIDGAVLVAAADASELPDGADAAEGGACGLGVEAGACQACVAERCCEQATACAKDPACARYETCLLGCGGDYGCRASCVIANPVGDFVDLPTLDQCVVASCEKPCGVNCGLPGAYTAPDAAQACQDCISARNCGALEACGASLDCEQALHCAYSCDTPDCQLACVSGSDGGFLQLALGVGSTCLSACDVGTYWVCLGRVTWPFPTPGAADVTLGVNESTSGSPVVGAVAKACHREDLTCANPISTGTTDASGKVTLKLPDAPAAGYGFQGYFDIASPQQAMVHYLYFLSFPLSEPHAQLAMLVLTPSALDGMVSVAHVSLDSTRGQVAVVAEDCLLTGAPGVSFAADAIDAQTKELYFIASELSTAATATDTSGLAFFFNVPPGALTIRATPKAVGAVSSTVSLHVQPGALSFVQAIPTP